MENFLTSVSKTVENMLLTYVICKIGLDFN